jgi:outer membrane immunogenic protein
MKIKFLAAVAALAMVPAAASADVGEGAYAGLQGGYHDIDGGADGGIFGGYLGYNFNTGGNLVVGVEANANIGTGDIDAEYGASVHIGGKFGDNGLLFARGGYQEVDFENFGSDGDYLLGVGAEFGIGERTSLRAVLDTIAFDSTRATAGFSFRF